MRHKWILAVVFLLLLLTPSAAMARQDTGSGNEDDVLIRINGPVDVAAGESISTVVVISDHANVAGQITEALFVFDGSAVISGVVDGDVFVFSGDIELVESAVITGDLNLYDSSVDRAPGSTVSGGTNERSAFTWTTLDTIAVSAFLWVTVTVLSIVTALLFAAVGGRQLVASARNITERTGGTVVAAVLGGLLIPFFAIVAFFTIAGIGVGLALLLLLMPLMVILGYIVAGTRIGLAIAARGRDLDTVEHPYLGAALGVVVLHLIGLIPFLGGVVQFLAAVVGAGALTLLAWDAWRGFRQAGTDQARRDAAQRPSPAISG